MDLKCCTVTSEKNKLFMGALKHGYQIHSHWSPRMAKTGWWAWNVSGGRMDPCTDASGPSSTAAQVLQWIEKCLSFNHSFLFPLFIFPFVLLLFHHLFLFRPFSFVLSFFSIFFLYFFRSFFSFSSFHSFLFRHIRSDWSVVRVRHIDIEWYFLIWQDTRHIWLLSPLEATIKQRRYVWISGFWWRSTTCTGDI